MTIRDHSSSMSIGLQGLGRRLHSLRHVRGYKSSYNGLEKVILSSTRLLRAFNIIGRTLYSLFQLPVKQKKLDLSNVTLQSLQAQFQDTRFLIINKKSIIDLNILSLIDDRLQLIFLDQLDQAFRGLTVLLCRDFFQLLPINGCPLYATRPTGLVAIKGQGLY